MNLREFLYRHTKANTFAVIKDSGYIAGVVFIDYEDLSTLALPQELLNAKVISSSIENHPSFTQQIYIVDIQR